MIRDKNKIYGEVNDANTVLAQGTLTTNKPIVGDGNKSTKTYNGTANTLLGLDGNGNMTSVASNTLSVQHADSADSATNATNATNADSATNATNAAYASQATKIEYVTVAPTASPAAGTLQIYVGTALPNTTYDRVLYLITY